MIDSLKASVFKNNLSSPMGYVAKTNKKREFSMSFNSSKSNKFDHGMRINSVRNTDKKFIVINKFNDINLQKSTV